LTAPRALRLLDGIGTKGVSESSIASGRSNKGRHKKAPATLIVTGANLNVAREWPQNGLSRFLILD